MRRLSTPVLLVAVLALAMPAVAQDMTCADCHDEVAAGMTHNIHMRIRAFEVQGREVGCEGCHGDGTAHMEEGDPALIRTFSEYTAEDAQVCFDCHQGAGVGAAQGGVGVAEWMASTHAMEGLTCFDCHGSHETRNALDSCADCHPEVEAQFQLPSHHPVREGKMDCNSCHNPHRATEAMLNTDMRSNDLCYSCHQVVEGPYIFEHEPVVEDCANCHSPHGAVVNNLLKASQPMLCLQCHDLHFHAGFVSPEHDEEIGNVNPRTYRNPLGEYSMNYTFTSTCTQCHSQIHGSDLPTQALTSGGHGLVR